jgi:hypothetical protein
MQRGSHLSVLLWERFYKLRTIILLWFSEQPKVREEAALQVLENSAFRGARTVCIVAWTYYSLRGHFSENEK